MRLKKVQGAKEIVENSKYIIQNMESYRGKYKEIFNNDNPIHVEIGTGKGDFIVKMAETFPNINFIGIEKYESVLYKAIIKLEEKQLNNLRFICMDALGIENVFDKEVDRLYLNFSDPWPKKRHAKRRLTSENFLKKYDLIFKNVNNIIMKTDNQALFEYSVISLTNYGYKINNISLNLHETDEFNIETEYERKFSSKGFRIYKIDVFK